MLPTVLEFAQIAVPQDEYKGRRINTPSGYSWKAKLENQALQVRPSDFSFASELHGNKYALQGDWKIAQHANQKLGTGTWQLYNLKQDRGEQINLAEQHPEKVAQLAQVYDHYRQNTGVLSYH